MVNDFVTEQEEANLVEEVEPIFKRTRYQFSHWDDVGYFLINSRIENNFNDFNLRIISIEIIISFCIDSN